MGLFGNKKEKDSLRTLSEKEIQQKLYGGFHPPQNGAGARGWSGKNKKKPVAQSSSAESKSSDLFRASQPIEIKKLEDFERRLNLSPRPPDSLHPTRPSVEDFQDRLHKDTQHVHDLERKKEQERLARLSEWADEEVENVVKASQQKWQRDRRPKATLPVSRVSLKSSVLGPVQHLLSRLIFGILSVLKVVLTAFYRSKPLRYGVLSFAFLFALFLSIHTLNVRREISMKTPHRTIAPVVVPPHENVAVVKESPLKAAIKPPPAAVKSVQEPVAEQSAATPATSVSETQAKAQENPYVIQVATYSSAADAEALLNRLKAAQLPCFVKGSKRQGGKSYYSVYIGRFRTFRDAQKGLEEFRREEIAGSFKDAFVRTL